MLIFVTFIINYRNDYDLIQNYSGLPVLTYVVITLHVSDECSPKPPKQQFFSLPAQRSQAHVFVNPALPPPFFNFVFVNSFSVLSPSLYKLCFHKLFFLLVSQNLLDSRIYHRQRRHHYHLNLAPLFPLLPARCF